MVVCKEIRGPGPPLIVTSGTFYQLQQRWPIASCELGRPEDTAAGEGAAQPTQLFAASD